MQILSHTRLKVHTNIKQQRVDYKARVHDGQVHYSHDHMCKSTLTAVVFFFNYNFAYSYLPTLFILENVHTYTFL